jgi:hypothetical protein
MNYKSETRRIAVCNVAGDLFDKYHKMLNDKMNCKKKKKKKQKKNHAPKMWTNILSQILGHHRSEKDFDKKLFLMVLKLRSYLDGADRALNGYLAQR